jgi:hypothetical protein
MWFSGSCGKNHSWKVNYYMFNTKEHVIYENLSESHVGVITLNCPNHKSQIMIMQRWPLSQTILDGHCLLWFATHNEHHVSKDEEGTIGVKYICLWRKKQRDSSEDSNVATKWTHEHELWTLNVNNEHVNLTLMNNKESFMNSLAM